MHAISKRFNCPEVVPVSRPRPCALPPARRHAQRAGLPVVADRVVDARVVARLALGKGLEAAAALDGHELKRRPTSDSVAAASACHCSSSAAASSSSSTTSSTHTRAQRSRDSPQRRQLGVSRYICRVVYTCIDAACPAIECPASYSKPPATLAVRRNGCSKADDMGWAWESTCIATQSFLLASVLAKTYPLRVHLPTPLSCDHD